MSDLPEFRNVIPVLPSKDVEQAVDFYVNRLGFVLRFCTKGRDGAMDYAGVSRGQVLLHLQWHDAAEWAVGIVSPMLRLEIENPSALFDEYSSQSVFHEHTQLRKTDWGTHEFAFFDPDHNGLTFFSYLKNGEK